MNNKVLYVRWGRVSVGPEEAQRRVRAAFNLVLGARHKSQAATPERPASDETAVASQPSAAG